MGITIKNISKKYEDNIILDNISFEFKKGIIYGLVGYNGSGKSTLAKIIAGRTRQNSGQLFLDDSLCIDWNIRKAIKSGIFHIDPYTTLIPRLSVAENVKYAINATNNWNVIKSAFKLNNINKRFKELLKKYDIDIDAEAEVGQLTYGAHYIIEILRVILCNPKFVIIDEIDSYLNSNHRRIIDNILQDLIDGGTCILYISHDLENVFRISDKILIISDNKISNVIDTKTDNHNQAVESVFNTLKEKPPRIKVKPQETIFECNQLSNSVIKDFTMSVREGEIVGILGLNSDGENSLDSILFSNTGIKKFRDKRIKINSPEDFISAGIIYLNAKNINSYLFEEQDLVYNMLPYNIKIKNYPREYQKEMTNKYLDRLSINANYYDKVKNISTGFQKKLLLVRSVLSKGEVFIFVGLTDNLDVVSKVDIYNIINELKRNGKGIILSSDNYDEIVGLSDIIYIVKEGKVKYRIDNSNSDEREILSKSILNESI